MNKNAEARMNRDTEARMNRAKLLSFSDTEVTKLLAQYAEYMRINAILILGQEPKAVDRHHITVADSLFEAILDKSRVPTNGKTGSSWNLFSSTHQKITKERRLELQCELEKISNAMKFANPAIWMIYKSTAYIGTDKHNPNVQTFVDHTRYEQICGKRIAYVNEYMRANYHGDDLFSGTILPLHMDLIEAAKNEFIIELCKNTGFMRGWEAGEFNSKGKWL